MQRADHVYADLKELIVGYEFQPGESLSEKALAELFEVSRTPVREAFQRLSREGLVPLVPGRGAFVAEISLPDIVELYQMREALEPQAARLAAGRGNDVRIQSLIDELGSAEVLITGDVGAYYDLSARIDETISILAGNARMTRALGEIWTQVRRARRVASTSTPRLLASVDEHRAILAAIAQGDGGVAFVTTVRHVQTSLSHLLFVSGGHEPPSEGA